jgi:hypothetical protein
MTKIAPEAPPSFAMKLMPSSVATDPLSNMMAAPLIAAEMLFCQNMLWTRSTVLPARAAMTAWPPTLSLNSEWVAEMADASAAITETPATVWGRHHSDAKREKKGRLEKLRERLKEAETIVAYRRTVK